MKRAHLIFLFPLFLAILQACTSPASPQVDPTATASVLREIPTWTARPMAQVEDAAATVSSSTAEGEGQGAQNEAPLSAVVTIMAINGNVYVRRGPSIDYNPVGVLYESQSVTAIGRDRVRRWVYVEASTGGRPAGWVSTLTDFTYVAGDVDELPLVTTEPAEPAFIRNCTKHVVWILPAQVQLLPRANEPYNEERFPPGEYLVYDLDVSGDISIQEISLREGLLVEILVDGNGEKSKCY